MTIKRNIRQRKFRLTKATAEAAEIIRTILERGRTAKNANERRQWKKRFRKFMFATRWEQQKVKRFVECNQ